MKEPVLYKIIRPIITFLFKLLYTAKIIGKENIPKKGKIILAGTHTHNFDSVLLISSTKRCIHFLAKKELWKGPKKVIFSNMGLIPVNRKIHDATPLLEAERYLKNGKVIGIFPEGTFRKEKNTLLPFKKGAVKMAYDTNTKIVPFAITGDYKIFSRNLKIVFGKPFVVKSDDFKSKNEKLKSTIQDMMEGKN